MTRKWKPNAKQKALIKEVVKKAERKKCVACNGSGYYDNTGSPKCGTCGGLGSVRSQSS